MQSQPVVPRQLERAGLGVVGRGIETWESGLLEHLGELPFGVVRIKRRLLLWAVVTLLGSESPLWTSRGHDRSARRGDV